MGDAFPSGNVAFEFDSFGRYLVGPGEDECEGEAEENKEREYLDDPVRGFKDGQDGGRNLNQQPSDNGVGHCDLDDVASFQLTPDRSHLSPLGRASFLGLILPSSGR